MDEGGGEVMLLQLHDASEQLASTATTNNYHMEGKVKNLRAAVVKVNVCMCAWTGGERVQTTPIFLKSRYSVQCVRCIAVHINSPAMCSEQCLRERYVQ